MFNISSSEKRSLLEAVALFSFAMVGVLGYQVSQIRLPILQQPYLIAIVALVIVGVGSLILRNMTAKK
jgi:hypothetical protein